MVCNQIKDFYAYIFYNELWYIMSPQGLQQGWNATPCEKLQIKKSHMSRILSKNVHLTEQYSQTTYDHNSL